MSPANHHHEQIKIDALFPSTVHNYPKSVYYYYLMNHLKKCYTHRPGGASYLYLYKRCVIKL